MRTANQILSGFGRCLQQRSTVVRPEKYRLLRPHFPPCIGRGQGRSYGDAALNENYTVILTERLNRFLAFDAVHGILTAESGVTLAEILAVIVPAGWFLPVTPGTAYISLGGAVAADVHGKNHHVAGSLGKYIQALTLITAAGEMKLCSPSENAALFWATIGGMGLTGLIGDITLKLKPLPSRVMRVQVQPYGNLAEIIAVLTADTLQVEYSVAWIEGLNKKTLGRSLLFEGRHASLQEIPANYQEKVRVPKKWPLPYLSSLLKPSLVKLFNSAYFSYHSHCAAGYFVDYISYFYPLDHVAQWNLLYGKAGFTQLQCVLPFATALSGYQQLFQLLNQANSPVFLAVLKRLGEQGEGLLSFAQPGITLAIDMPFQGQTTFALLQKCHAHIIEMGGRVYLAKDIALGPAQFQQMYPRYAAWLSIKKSIDPQHVFQSSLSRRLGINY